MKKEIVLTKKWNIIITSCIIAVALTITIITGIQFHAFSTYQTKFAIREDVITRIEKFSDYSPKLKGTVGDSDIYVFEGEEPGPSILIIGGTHPNEPAGQVTSTLFLENVIVKKGTVYVITEANKSAYTHSHPQEGSVMYYHIETEYGVRTFKFGSRATNTNEQWPNPDIYVHNPSGQKLSMNDVRNLNRSYPGKIDGNYTERVAYAITQCIIKNDITMTIDLHEASPEYLTINAIVGHIDDLDPLDPNYRDSVDLASLARLYMDMEGIAIGVEPSPKELHGLTHRELGDYTNTLVFLCETSNASQGKLRGAFTEDLIITGKDKFYEKASELGLLYADPVHLNVRVARHTLSILSIIRAYNENNLENPLIIENMPTYNDIINNGIGKYLLEIK